MARLRVQFSLIFAAAALVPMLLVFFFTGLEMDYVIGGVFAGSAIFSIVAGVAFARRIARPVEELNKGAAEFSKGNFNYRVEASGSGEIGRLAEAFNKMAENVKRMYEREQNVSSMKTEFIMVAAHKLRTPLNAIRWTFNILMSKDTGPLNEMQRKTVKDGSEVTERMVKLVGDLLNVSEIEQGKFGYDFESANILEIIGGIVEAQKLRAQDAGIRLTFSKPATAVPPLALDVDRIGIALGAVVDNAIRYSPNGGNVEIALQQDAENVVVSVKDEGMGIPKDHMPKLFSKFSRATNAVRLYTEGSGLGLYIARNIILRHGGDIRAASEEGKGSVFYVYLPLHMQEKIEAADGEFKALVENL